MDLAGVDLNLLVAFEALMDERSVTRAASRVGLSQPGMSNTLARLRKLIGDPVLVRDGTALVPTPRAEALRQPVRDALALIRGALEARPVFDPARDRAACTVSCSDYSLLMLIGPLVRQLAAAAPGVTIRVLPRSQDPVRLLRDGEADLVIEPAEIMPESALTSLRLFSDRWLCCVWEGNTAVGARMTREAYLELPHLVYSMGRGGQPPSIVDRHLEHARLTRRIEFTVESFLLAPYLLEGTNLVTVVPERAVPHLRRTAAIRVLEPPVELPAITQTLWWHPRRTDDPAHAWVRDRIAAIAARVGSAGSPHRPVAGNKATPSAE
jgi:LysR family nod box-dependent transcriptional activator